MTITNIDEARKVYLQNGHLVQVLVAHNALEARGFISGWEAAVKECAEVAFGMRHAIFNNPRISRADAVHLVATTTQGVILKLSGEGK